MLVACLRDHLLYQEEALCADCFCLAMASNLDLAFVADYGRTLTRLVSLSACLSHHGTGEFAPHGTFLEYDFERRV